MLNRFFRDDTTQNSVVITPSDRSENLAFVPIQKEWTTDKPHKGRTKIKWNRTSSLVAVHDRMAKHSNLHIFRVTDARADCLVVPDLRKKCARDLGVAETSLRSSGKVPSKWVDASVLEVVVRLKTNRGGTLPKKNQLGISGNGKIVLLPSKQSGKRGGLGGPAAPWIRILHNSFNEHTLTKTLRPHSFSQMSDIAPGK